MSSSVKLQGPPKLYGAKINLSANRCYQVDQTGIVWVSAQCINEMLALGFWPASDFSPFSQNDLLGNFAFGDATPALIGILQSGIYNPTARIDLLSVFDVPGASISLGTLADPDLVIPASSCNPYEQAIYQTNPSLILQTDTQIYLFIQPGTGANQGAGRYWLHLV